jgi:hypothetical protein
MFRSARSMNSRKAKEGQHGIISPPCVVQSRQRESGRCLMQRVRRGYSVEMPELICLMSRLHSVAASGCLREIRAAEHLFKTDRQIARNAWPRPVAPRQGHRGWAGADHSDADFPSPHQDPSHHFYPKIRNSRSR